MVHVGEGAALDKTWAEITAAIESCNIVMLVVTVSDGVSEEHHVLLCANYSVSDLGDEVYYLVSLYNLYNQMTETFVASSADGYPVYSEP